MNGPLVRYETVTYDAICVGFRNEQVSVAVCNIDRLPDTWWVSRVFVRPQYRRQQLGSRCLSRAIDLLAQQDGPRRVVVAPGGYDLNYEEQSRFYARHGFVGDGLMERQLGQ